MIVNDVDWRKVKERLEEIRNQCVDVAMDQSVDHETTMFYRGAYRAALCILDLAEDPKDRVFHSGKI